MAKYYVRPDGLHEAMRRVNGKRVVFRGKTDREVDKKILEFSQQSEKGPLFSEVAEAWKEAELNSLRQNVAKNYLNYLEVAAEYFDGDYIKNIDATNITAFLETLAAKGLSAHTVKNYLSAVSVVFRYWVGNMHGAYNPALSAKIPRTAARKVERTPPTQEQIELVKANPNMFAMLFMYTGCRLGEIHALQKSDIDLDTDTIHITKSASWVGNKPIIGDTKTAAGHRDVVLLPPLKEYLLPILNELDPEDYITSRGPKAMTQSAYTFQWAEYCRNLGMATPVSVPVKKKTAKGVYNCTKIVWKANVTAHQFRHWFASFAVAAGLDEKELQGILGHADPYTTKRIYSHILEVQKQDSRDKLTKMLKNMDF